MNDRGRSIALLIVAGVMLLVCVVVMAGRRVRIADLAATEPTTCRIDVNQADRDTLTLLPGIGQGKAQRIINTRQAHGPFQQVSDLTQVPMIGQRTAAAMKPWVRFE